MGTVMVSDLGERITKLSLLVVGGISGLIVAAALSPTGPYFWGNFRFYWLPHAAILGLMCWYRAPAALTGGVGLGLALYLAAFGWWVFSREHPDSMSWLGYLFSLPGGAIGAVIAMCWTFLHPKRNLETFLIGLGLVSLGIILNQSLLCATVMYCRQS